MQVRLTSRLSEGVEQPESAFDKIEDYFLEVIDYPQEGMTRRIIVNEHSQGGFGLEKWEYVEKDGTPCLRVYLQVSIMGHELDQWVTYDLETGERLS